MADIQPGNRVPTYPTPKPYEDNPANAQSAVPKPDYGEGLILSNVTDGGIDGQRPWKSHPVSEDTFTIEAGEHFAKQGSLPARKNVNPEDGTIETFSHRND